MLSPSKPSHHLNNAFNALLDKQSTKAAKRIARQVLFNNGFTDSDITQCLKQRTLQAMFIFEA
ncbi:hypothetical protein LHL20_01240 [Alteromonas sp. McT4-15]|uniref:hypothetical protein n=1 Tax=Alteromonas sp. McT4-15 TaxID=2881256 RepID=UPI001CF85C7B|nr:hypothetical protein [Alteromonas sp. McT4-15]MCB4434861.1 hypothetical protein [Alteromonas sp. McT4-15]MEC8231119.1 hypothetical protein [Pseudomonadota bacterium]